MHEALEQERPTNARLDHKWRKRSFVTRDWNRYSAKEINGSFAKPMKTLIEFLSIFYDILHTESNTRLKQKCK